MNALTIVLFVAGIGLLIGGAEALIRGASRLAVALGISPLIVGLTVVAFGTSSPELAVTIMAVRSGAAGADVALGNVVGSNIANVLLILGLSAVVVPLSVAAQIVRKDLPLLIIVSFIVYLFALDGVINRLEGVILTAGVIGYTIFAIIASRRESASIQAEYGEVYGPPHRGIRETFINLVLIGGGLGLLTLGSRWLVDGAVEFARLLGVSELIIGLTIVAVGTSLPEIAASVLAGVRGERDIAVGNIIGSCLFNLLAVLGTGSVIAPGGIAVPENALAFDLPVMIATSIVCLPIFINGGEVKRWEGALFLAYYVAYTAYLLLAAMRHALLQLFGIAMIGFVIPLTIITLSVVLLRELRNRRLVPPERP
ncbi:MAG: calcium/sodium antiporter [Chloroflexi bacterium]|nr:calcium/sodium antiporter [Chloroflexota bacterium]